MKRLSLLGTTLNGIVFGFIPIRRTIYRSGILQCRHYSAYTNQTVEHVLDNSVEKFALEQVPEPYESSLNLLTAALNLPWDSGYRDLVNRDRKLLHRRLSDTEAEVLETLIRRRKRHEPIQYILGQWDFMGNIFKIQAPLLCPRPETEELVDLVLSDTTHLHQELRILDVGCGSGCIGITLAEKLPNARVTAIDIEPIAIETASWNAKQILPDREGRRYTAVLASASEFRPSEAFDIVVSNPPYIPSADMSNLDRVVLDYESSQALDGGPDGLDVIRTILDQLSSWGVPDCVLWMETDPTHPGLLQDMLSKSHKLVFEGYHCDVFGKQRFVKIRYDARVDTTLYR